MDEKKVREAIEIIKSIYPTSGYYMLCEALDIAVKALEKQLPKKVEVEEWSPLYVLLAELNCLNFWEMDAIYIQRI